jgi:DNA-binding response OmpR family regulator
LFILHPLYPAADGTVPAIYLHIEHFLWRTKTAVKTLIIVEPDALLGALYALELSDEGYDILLAKTDSEALKILETRSADLFITDIQHCSEAATSQKNTLFERITCPIIINTGYPSDLMSNFSLHTIAYVWKSSDTRQLKRQIRLSLAVAENISTNGKDTRRNSLFRGQGKPDRLEALAPV